MYVYMYIYIYTYMVGHYMYICMNQLKMMSLEV